MSGKGKHTLHTVILKAWNIFPSFIAVTPFGEIMTSIGQSIWLFANKMLSSISKQQRRYNVLASTEQEVVESHSVTL